MENLTKLKDAALKARALVALRQWDEAQDAMRAVLNEIAVTDPAWQAMALAGEQQQRPVRPNPDTFPIDPRDYSAGRTLYRLGIKPDHDTMRSLYEDTRRHKDLIEAMRRHNLLMDSGEPVAGPPPVDPLGGIQGLCAISPRKLLEQVFISPAQARAHAHAAAVATLKAEHKTAVVKSKTRRRRG